MTPTIQVIIIPAMTANHLCLCHMMSVISRQNSDSMTPGSFIGPSVSAEPCPWMTIPALYNPITAMKNPIPADMASFIDLGMLSSIFVL